MGLSNPTSFTGGTSPITPAVYTWATKPSAVGLQYAEIHITDVSRGQSGTGGGARFISNNVRWKPVNGECKIDGVDSPNVGTAVATEQVLTTTPVPIPAGLAADLDRFEFNHLTMSKSGTSETCTIRIRFGTTATAADPVLATITTLAGANQTFGTRLVFKRVSATSIQREGNSDTAGSFSGPATGAYPAAVAVSNMDSNVMYFTITAQMSTGVEIPTLQGYAVILQSTDNS